MRSTKYTKGTKKKSTEARRFRAAEAGPIAAGLGAKGGEGAEERQDNREQSNSLLHVCSSSWTKSLGVGFALDAESLPCIAHAE